ncbi:DUF3048 domain-containing protein [Allofournierella massiliensis]|uniref:DUF3048 domain-containing protein n=1 Tax=Allofournierella massiliensis TaxID=1650663 RepID=UPI0024B0AFE6|nr:DUF3048 domain-containing protein [Fournierella massiliensis]
MRVFYKAAALALSLALLAGCGKGADSSQAQASASSQAASSQAEQQVPELPQAENDMPMPAEGISALTGRETEYYGQRPVAVMLYNDKAAWPQWGIGDTELLIEANTEGQGSWLMAVYDGVDALQKVGPVGQGRDLFLQMVMPLQAIPMYVGSDAYTSNLVNYYGYQPLDGIYTGTSAFDLDTERAKLYLEQYSWYTTSSLVPGALGLYGQSSEGKPNSFFQFAEGSVPQNSQGYELAITYGSERTARLVYNPDDQRYYLREGDTPQTDANRPEDSEVRFSNVILLMASSGMKDNGVTRQYDLSGGEGLYLSGGGVQTIRWEKGDAMAPLKLYDQNGSMLNVQPGRTYLGIYGGFAGQSLKLLDASGAEQALPSAPAPLPTAVPTPSPEPTPEPTPEPVPTEAPVPESQPVAESVPASQPVAESVPASQPVTESVPASQPQG